MTELSVPPVDAPTEARNPRTLLIDTLSTIEILRLLNAEDAVVPAAVERTLPELAAAVDLAVERVHAGGRIHYFGAGTSGRLGVIDAAELPPTFSAESGLVVAHHAGGSEAIVHAVEDVEDSDDLGVADAAVVARDDMVVGIAASGRTPYVAGALRTARARGAATVLVSGNPAAPLAELADVHLAPDTGPEAIAGSTRLKAGTATKLVLNAFSTALMVRLGRTYSNLMVSVVATNSKLRGRLIKILADATGASDERCRAALEACDGDLKAAIVTTLAGTSASEARAALAEVDGAVRPALARLSGIRPDGHPRTRTSWVVGLDVGASGSRARLAPRAGEGPESAADGRGVVIGEQGLDVAALATELLPVLRRLGDPARAEVAAAGIAGVPDLATDLRPLHDALAATLGVTRTIVASDAVTSFVGALGMRPGVVLAAGTGVIALGTDFDRQWRRVDGWGHLLGDDGGGAWIGMQGVRAALRAGDGRRGGSNDLLERAVRRFGEPGRLPAVVYARGDRAAALASFAPDVVEAAVAGDAPAAQIVAAAGGHLAEAAAAALIPGGDPVIAYAGGLFAAGEPLLAPLRETLAELAPDAVLTAAVGSALDGAVALARLAATSPAQIPERPPYIWTIEKEH